MLHASGTAARRAAAALASVVVVAAAASTAPALGQEGPTVIDPLEDAEVPTAAEIAGSITPIEPVVAAIEVPEPRSLRTEVDEAERTTVSIASDVLFAFDSAELTARSEAVVRDLAADIGEATGTISVVGHTDSVGTDAYNQDLSERRAAAVAAVLEAELGSGFELVTEGRGSLEPVVEESEEDPGAAARNRRVEITFDR